MSAETALADEVVAFVHNRDRVSFAELARQWPEHFAKGNREVVVDNANVVLWAGVSEEGLAALTACLANNRIEAQPAMVWTYVADGLALNYPIARTVRRYRARRWLPILLCAPEKKPEKAKGLAGHAG